MEASLLWSEWSEPGEVTRMTLGFMPLLKALTGQRSSWPARLLGALLMAPGRDAAGKKAGESKGEVADTRAGTSLGSVIFLPRRFRALIVFIDAVAAGPWEALSGQSRIRTPWDLARLSAGIVRAAFIHALLSVLERAESSEVALPLSDRSPEVLGRLRVDLKRIASGPDSRFLQSLRRGEPPELVEWQDDEIQKHFEALSVPLDLTDIQPEAGRLHTVAELLRCFKALLSHPAYLELRR